MPFGRIVMAELLLKSCFKLSLFYISDVLTSIIEKMKFS